MSVTRAGLVFAALAFAACSSSGLWPREAPVCDFDEQCGNGQLCFAEGCGDPGTNIVVEVTGSSLTSLYARDFAISNGTLSKTRDFDLGAPLTIGGEFQRERTAMPNPANRTVYSGGVTVRAVGESTLIPGARRSYETIFDLPERGQFQMNVGTGKYEVTAYPHDPAVPPLVMPDVLVQQAMSTGSLTFAFPAVDGAPIVAGQLVKALNSTILPNDPVLLTVENLEVQLIDPDTRRPLSHRYPVSSTTGEFLITANPEVTSQTSMMLVASPRGPDVALPSKTFMLTNPLPAASILEFGDFGVDLPVAGRVVDQRGLPVEGAQVYLEGVVGGGGTFRSRVESTDADGKFTVRSLASRQAGSFTLTISPPKNHPSGYTRRSATVSITAGEASLEPDVITLDDSLVVKGLVLTPAGEPAAGVLVKASVQEPAVSVTDSRMIPLEPAETLTDVDGSFELSLDPGVWRFEYVPGSLLPLASRLVTIKAPSDDGGVPQMVVELPTVQLAQGRKVTGYVTGFMGTRAGAPVPDSTLRFFRVAPVEGRPSAILLGSAFTDERGRYEVVLPDATRSP